MATITYLHAAKMDRNIYGNRHITCSCDWTSGIERGRSWEETLNLYGQHILDSVVAPPAPAGLTIDEMVALLEAALTVEAEGHATLRTRELDLLIAARRKLEAATRAVPLRVRGLR